jgi:hypothetical protein
MFMLSGRTPLETSRAASPSTSSLGLPIWRRTTSYRMIHSLSIWVSFAKMRSSAFSTATTTSVILLTNKAKGLALSPGTTGLGTTVHRLSSAVVSVPRGLRAPRTELPSPPNDQGAPPTQTRTHSERKSRTQSSSGTTRSRRRRGRGRLVSNMRRRKGTAGMTMTGKTMTMTK